MEVISNDGGPCTDAMGDGVCCSRPTHNPLPSSHVSMSSLEYTQCVYGESVEAVKSRIQRVSPFGRFAADCCTLVQSCAAIAFPGETLKDVAFNGIVTRIFLACRVADCFDSGNVFCHVLDTDIIHWCMWSTTPSAPGKQLVWRRANKLPLSLSRTRVFFAVEVSIVPLLMPACHCCNASHNQAHPAHVCVGMLATSMHIRRNSSIKNTEGRALRSVQCRMPCSVSWHSVEWRVRASGRLRHIALVIFDNMFCAVSRAGDHLRSALRIDTCWTYSLMCFIYYILKQH